jgi:ADP-ribose pyrophosphatase YjhB (NUDIX family)
MAAELMAHDGDEQAASLIALFERESGYATPKVDVRAAVFDVADRLLLMRERSDGLWALPGGWADVGASPARNVEREVAEEAGYRVRASKLLAVWDRSLQGHVPAYPFHVYKLFFRCELLDEESQFDPQNPEISEVGFFAQDHIPALSCGRVLPAQIERMFAHHRHPHWPADFD